MKANNRWSPSTNTAKTTKATDPTKLEKFAHSLTEEYVWGVRVTPNTSGENDDKDVGGGKNKPSSVNDNSKNVRNIHSFNFL